MNIPISAGDGEIERDVEVQPIGNEAAFRALPFEARRGRVLELVAENRRRRMRAIDGGKA